MINQLMMTIIDKKTIAKDTIEMRLAGGAIVRTIEPGQFVHINVGNQGSHMLRRPISIADINESDESITIIFKVIGSGTEDLQSYQIGQELDVLLPCGSGYPIKEINVKKALLVGGGIGVPPLYYLGKKLKENGVEVESVIGFQTKSSVFYEQQFAELGACHVVTDDGSYGWKGYVTDVIDQLDFDYYFSCGPTGMLRAVSNKLENHKGFISIEQRMGCGIGACYACVVPTNDDEKNGFKKICKDGPVFRANEVVI